MRSLNLDFVLSVLRFLIVYMLVMKRFACLLFSAFIVSAFCFAQKKEIAQAQSVLKSGKNVEKAEEAMRKLLADSANRQNLKIWQVLTEAVKMQYEQGNEQLYLKQKYDTASLFNIERRMFQAYEGMDSVDMLPDKKGRVELKFRKRNSEYLNRFRRNLYNGGTYFISKRNYLSAFNLFDTFLDCVRQPLFSAMKYSYTSSVELSAAYLATCCAAKIGVDSLALKYSDYALMYKPGREKVQQILAAIYYSQNDTASYKKVLTVGFDENPKSEFFFTRLIDLLNNENAADSALAVADRAIAADTSNLLFPYAKSNILLNIGRYTDCIKVCDSLILRNDSLAEAYYNAGVAYLNMAFEAEKNGNKKSQIKKYYNSALPYMERYRELAPDQKDKWAAALYNIYLNLNMGKKFEEITDLLKK